MYNYEDEKDNKYILYARKSSEDEDRQTLSIDSQIDELRKIAIEKKLNIVEIIKESKSAKEPGRPLFNEMLRKINAGEANGILCWKFDRLARNPIDGGSLTWMLQKGIIKYIHTFGKTYTEFDNSILLGVEFGQANQFIRELSINVKRGLRKKVELGWLSGVAPSGYLNTPDREKGCKIIIKDPERFLLIRKAWDLMLEGTYSIPQIHDILNNKWHYKTVKRRRLGNKPLALSSLYKIFTNPFYYGYFEFPNGSGNWHKGSHEPMITEDEYDRVQIILGKRSKPRPKTRDFAFTGLMKCGNCGCAITAEEKIKRQKNGNIHKYIYYHCTKRKNEKCIEKSIEIKDLNIQIDEILNKIAISEKFKNWAIKYLHEIRKNEAETNEIILSNKQKELNNIVNQLDSLFLSFTAPSNQNHELILPEEYQTHKSLLIKQKQAIESELKATGKHIESWLELSEKTFNFAAYANIWFKNGDNQTKRSILACLGSNLSIKDQKINVKLHPFFKTFILNRESINEELESVRTHKNSMNKRKNTALGDVLPNWLPASDSDLKNSDFQGVSEDVS